MKLVKEYLQVHNLESMVDFRGGHCFGTCHLGPVIEINGVLYEKLTEEKLVRLLDDVTNRNKS